MALFTRLLFIWARYNARHGQGKALGYFMHNSDVALEFKKGQSDATQTTTAADSNHVITCRAAASVCHGLVWEGGYAAERDGCKSPAH